MAYEVRLNMPEKKVGRKPVIFDVEQGGSVLGKLKVTKGGIVWVRKNGGKKNTYECRWQTFDGVMAKEELRAR